MSRKLNILTTCLRYPPAPGGAEEMIYQSTEGLSKKGHNVQVLTSNLRSHSIPPVYLTAEEYQNDPPYVRRFRAKYQGKFPYPYFQGMLKAALQTKNLDLIYTHNFYYYSADIAWLLSKIKRVPFILHPYFYLESREAKKWFCYRKIFGSLTMAADCVIAISEFEKALILKDYKPKKIIIIPPGIESALKQKIPYNVFEQYNIQDENIIFFAGRICYGKGVDILIKALPEVLKKHPNTIVAIAGTDFADKETFVHLAIKYNVQDKLLWLGKLKREDLHSAYQNATLFCLPTKYEAFGIVLAEAMAAGLPIVSTNHSAVPYLVPNNEAGFLTPVGDYKKTAYYINKLLSDPALRQKMGERGKKEAAKYDWNKMVGQLETLFQETIQ
ncbi:MAG: glycosyltransferase family 4 protein [Candidatus Doudnabacteria bacterium]